MRTRILAGILGILGLLLLHTLWLVGGRALIFPTSHEHLDFPRIYAYRDWQSTGIWVEPGDRIAIRAWGRWMYTPGEYHGPEGHPKYRAPHMYPIPGVPGGILIGRIGEGGHPFVVGKGRVIYAPRAGILYLRINDDILSDNDGYVEVEIRVTRVTPTPSP